MSEIRRFEINYVWYCISCLLVLINFLKLSKKKFSFHVIKFFNAWMKSKAHRLLTGACENLKKGLWYFWFYLSFEIRRFIRAISILMLIPYFRTRKFVSTIRLGKIDDEMLRIVYLKYYQIFFRINGEKICDRIWWTRDVFQ